MAVDASAVKKKVEDAGISSYSNNGAELWLYHKGAARVYYSVDTEAKLDAAITEFKANTPPEWY